MKMVVAIVRPEKYEDVKSALKDRGITGMTFTHVTGRGMQAGIKFTNRVGDFVVDELEKVKIDIVVGDADVRCVIDTVCAAAYTGRHGDGRIFVLPVEDSVRISECGPKEEEPEKAEDGAAEEAGTKEEE